jgi:lincosamide and streptogramin A transport system ATP-binding/permease protein
MNFTQCLLNLLDLAEDCPTRPFASLSQGERAKVMLAALFLKENNFLLIDEPTDHLDAAARQTVGAYLNGKSGFILVSHDRAFLDGCIDHILSINRTDIEVQSGNFSGWLLNKERRDAFELSENAKLEADIGRLKTAARRKTDWSMAAERAKYSQHGEPCTENKDKGYIGHKAAKTMKSAKVFERRQTKAVEEKSALLKNVETAEDLKLTPLTYRRERLVEAKDLSVRYGGRTVFSGLNLTVNRGDRIFLRGKNGCGKSTLLKLIAGADIPHGGVLEVAGDLKISYVPQDASGLRGGLRDFIADNALDESLFKTILAKLDFTRGQFDKDIGEYSDGQKKKVLLARSLCESAHLYIWDEPLNYIDVLSRIQIETLLPRCLPTMLLVEHDAAFAAKIATATARVDKFAG